MNREEAIRKVENYLASYFPIEDYGEVEEIIKALEENPCIDVVSRQAVLNTLDFADKVLDEDRTVEKYKELLIARYKDLPSVAHTQKLGRWIFVDKTHEYAHCSECDYGNVDLFNGKPYNYCPNCGAKMGEDALTTMMSISDYKLIGKEECCKYLSNTMRR